MRGELGMVGHTSNARTLEAEAEGLRAQGHPQLQSRFKPHKTLSQKKKNN